MSPVSAPDEALAPPPASPPGALKRIMGNLAHLLGGKAAAGVVSLVYLVLASRTLGVNDYGVLVLVNAYAILIGSVVAFSGFHGVVRYGALALEAGDREGLAAIIRHMALIEIGCGVAALVVAAALAPLVGPRLGWSPQTVTAAMVYSLAVIGTVRATPQGLLQLDKRFDLIGVHQTVQPLVRLVGALIAWGTGAGLIGFLAAWLVSAVAEGLAMWALAWRSWGRLTDNATPRGRWRGVGAGNQGFGRFILLTNFDITLRELAPNLTPVTIGWVLGPAAAGLFALAQRASAVLQQPAVLLGQASYAVLAELAARGEMARLRLTVWRGAGLMALAGSVILLVLAAAGGHLLMLIGGPSFAGGGLLLVLVAAGRAANLATTPIASALTAMGLAEKSVVVALVVNIALYPALPPLLWWLPSTGAGWHAALQGAVSALLLAAMFARSSRVSGFRQ
ncbi:lipopolysaccharide biosynthesis protein [Sphingomonas naphthae]|uniref:Lipopolysaccharide biosynthesis protein n=1 Tax=Sphingomonas naphthae TaxID=1813468 RepID=A0ABY7TM51_9SPHN|nr:lipopolysaccharide biosynthesis protein [Sphingomonas naphthae]WCT73319.1 lipopolysaccharide biosynthesis protein [Sphingomonas naphthae]